MVHVESRLACAPVYRRGISPNGVLVQPGLAGPRGHRAGRCRGPQWNQTPYSMASALPCPCPPAAAQRAPQPFWHRTPPCRGRGSTGLKWPGGPWCTFVNYPESPAVQAGSACTTGPLTRRLVMWMRPCTQLIGSGAGTSAERPFLRGIPDLYSADPRAGGAAHQIPARGNIATPTRGGRGMGTGRGLEEAGRMLYSGTDACASVRAASPGREGRGCRGATGGEGVGGAGRHATPRRGAPRPAAMFMSPPLIAP